MTTPENIKTVIESLLGSIQDKASEMGKPLAELETVQDAMSQLENGDIDSFYYLLLYPLDQALDGLLATQLPTEASRFLVKNYSFLENHFERLVRQFEGNACCADKSRTIMRGLLIYLLTGTRIHFDYTQKYTYHFPKLIFTTHEDIEEFFEALRHFFYGSPEKYLKVITRVTLAAKAALDAQEQAQKSNMTNEQKK